MPLEFVQAPIKGMDDREGLLLPEGYSPQIKNLRMYNKRLEKRPSLSLLGGQNILGTSFLQAYIPAIGDNGNQLICFSGKNLYTFNAFSQTWTIYGRTTAAPGMGVGFVVAAVGFLNEVYSISEKLTLSNWNGTTYTEVSTDLGTPLAGDYLFVLNNHLVVVRPRTDAWYPARIKWSVNGDPTLWDTSNYGAGYLDIVETSTAPLTGAFTLGGKAFVTKAREIIEIIPTGQLDTVFRAVPRINGVGTVAPFSWASADYFGFFLGADNVYMFDGSTLKRVGDPIKSTLFSQRGGFDRFSSVQRPSTRGCVYPFRNEYWLTDIGWDRTYIYNYKDDAWYTDTYTIYDAEGVGHPFGYYALVDYYDTIGHYSIPSSFIAMMTPSGPMFLNEGSDAGDEYRDGPPRSYEAVFETKDLFAKDFRGEEEVPTLNSLNQVHAVAFQATTGKDYTVGISTDGGETWTEQSTTVNEWGIGLVFFTVTFQKIRFRIRNNTVGEFKVFGAISFEVKPAGMLFRA